MSNANPTVLQRLNELAQALFMLQVRLNARKAKFKSDEAALKKEYEDDTASIQEEMRRIGAEIWKLISENRGTLIQPGMKSFATLAAKFQLKGTATSAIKVTNAEGLMEFARAKGLLKKVAVPPSRMWKFNHATLVASVAKDSKLLEIFAPFIEVPKGEGLTIQPNETYVVEHGKDRISPPSVKVEKP